MATQAPAWTAQKLSFFVGDVDISEKFYDSATAPIYYQCDTCQGVSENKPGAVCEYCGNPFKEY